MGKNVFDFDVDGADTLKTVNQLTQIDGITNATFLCSNVSHYDVANTKAFTTYDNAWYEHYVKNKYWQIDPVIQKAFVHVSPFDWSELVISGQNAQKMMVEFRESGNGRNGLTIPVRAPNNGMGLLSICSDLGENDWSALKEKILQRSLLLAVNMLQREIDLPEQHKEFVPLHPREVELLFWLGRGKNSGDIAEIMGVTTNTVRTYSQKIKEKMQAYTNASAVLKAYQLGYTTKEP